MSADDDDGDRTNHGGSAGAGAHQSDMVRDLLLGLAGQIDQVAAMFGGNRSRRTDADGADTDQTFGAGSFGSGQAAAGAFSAGAGLGDVSGEITSLLAEIGDLLARLIAALIAVLEAIAKALRSTPADTSPPRHYQPIAVRIDSPRASRPPFPEPSPARATGPESTEDRPKE